MEAHTLKPSPGYQGKLVLVLVVIAGLVLIGGLVLGWLVGLDEGPRTGRNVALGFMVGDFVLFMLALILIFPYCRSLKYEIRDDEVIVHVGIWTKSVKHVPYRTVTNLKINRDIFDRWFFGLGSLNIQTAGMSGKTGAEEALVGLPNVQEVYEAVGNKLRRYRGAMGPTATEDEAGGVAVTMEAMLSELKAIRTALER